LTGNQLPIVTIDQTVEETIFELNKKKLGASLIVGDDLILLGIVTDGDIRRALLHWKDIVDLNVEGGEDNVKISKDD